jgi:hypothetical protein
LSETNREVLALWASCRERVRELDREIAEIAAGNHAYFACRKPNLAKKVLHERRHERLQEIKEELAALLRRSAA